MPNRTSCLILALVGLVGLVSPWPAQAQDSVRLSDNDMYFQFAGITTPPHGA